MYVECDVVPSLLYFVLSRVKLMCLRLHCHTMKFMVTSNGCRSASRASDELKRSMLQQDDSGPSCNIEHKLQTFLSPGTIARHTINLSCPEKPPEIALTGVARLYSNKVQEAGVSAVPLICCRTKLILLVVTWLNNIVMGTLKSSC